MTNRTINYLSQIYSLRDYVEPLAIGKGLSKGQYDRFIKSSPAIMLCGKVKNTDIHGPLYYSEPVRPEYQTQFYQQIGSVPHPNDPLRGQALLIPDKNGEVHQADVIAVEAMAEWRQFLKEKLRIDVPEHEPLPEGKSIYKAHLPAGFLDYVKNTKKQANK